MRIARGEKWFKKHQKPTHGARKCTISEKGGCSMTGIYQHTLDAKGRLFIPAKLREELGDTFYVTVSPEKCLSAYSQENWKAISEKAAAMTNLQQRLREFAGLTKSVTVVGSNNHAEFWDSARWDEICPLEALPENIAAVMEELDF